MRKNVKFLTSALVASTLLISSFPASFALGDTQFSSRNSTKNQTYTPSYSQNYNNNYNQDNSQDYGQNSGYDTSYNQDYSGGYGNYGQNSGGYTSNTYTNKNKYRIRPLQGRVVTIPPGVGFTASPQNQISTDNVTVGDTVTMQVGSDVAYNGAVAIPAGSTIEGNVVIADKEGMTQRGGRLKIVFNNAILPNGRRIPIKAKIKTNDGSGILIGETGLNRAEGVAKDTVAGAAGGALFGTVMGAIAGGKPGKGAIYGTAIGSGLGLLKAGTDKGNGVIIPAGAPVDIVLDSPLTVSPSASSNYNQPPSSNYNY